MGKKSRRKAYAKKSRSTTATAHSVKANKVNVSSDNRSLSRSEKSKVKSIAKPALYVPPKVMRPFAGMPDEGKLVAMRELLPAATLRLHTSKEFGSREFTLATIVPEMAQGVVRLDGEIMVSMQTTSRSNDPAHDLGLILGKLLAAEPGTVLRNVDIRQAATRLPEMVEPGERGVFELHQDLAFWLTSEQRQNEELQESIAQSKESLIPARMVAECEDVFWCEMSGEQFIRWVTPEDETTVYDALARLRESGQLDWGNAKFLGAFRGLGVVVPVWKLAHLLDADDLTDLGREAKAFEGVYRAALASSEKLSPQARQMRAGLVSREVALS